MDTLEDYLNASIGNMKNDLFKDVVKVKTDIKPMEDGQVILISDIKKVKLTLIDSKGRQREINAIAKIETNDANKAAGKKLAEDSGAFTTEAIMYSNILKSMETLMTEVGDENYIWPECYSCADKKFLFQDLCDIGYRIVPTYKFLDAEHTTLVMEAIGKFHALSVILKERSMFDMDELQGPYFIQENPAMDNMMKVGIDHLIKSMREFWEPEWSPVADRLDKYFGDGIKLMRDSWKNTKGKWDVINHGDFTMRNMLFHYPQNSSKPDGVKFVDFQMCNCSCFAFDVVNILYSSLMPTVREDNLTMFLTTYTNSLVNTLKIHKYKGSIPDINTVNEAMKALSFMTTAMPIFSLPFFIESSKEDVQKKAEEYFKAYDEVKASTPMIDYTDKNIKAVVQSELQRCMKQNIF